MGAISVSESDENVIYVGTGSADPRGNISMSNGIYKSVDSGKKTGNLLDSLRQV